MPSAHCRLLDRRSGRFGTTVLPQRLRRARNERGKVRDREPRQQSATAAGSGPAAAFLASAPPARDLSPVTGPVDQLSIALGERYRIRRELGRGGMAVVYLAFDLRPERPVAIKVLLREIALQLGADRFLNEIP